MRRTVRFSQPGQDKCEIVVVLTDASKAAMLLAIKWPPRNGIYNRTDSQSVFATTHMVEGSVCIVLRFLVGWLDDSSR